MCINILARIQDIITLLLFYCKLPYELSIDIVNITENKIKLNSAWHAKDSFFLANCLSSIDRLLGHDLCLKRALFLYSIFATTNNSVDLCIGISVKQANEGHAWITVNDVPDLTPDAEKQYALIAKFKHRPV